MKLKDFPLVLRAFKEIEFDNGGNRARNLKPEVDVPDEWLVPFDAAEGLFTIIEGMTVKDVPALEGKEEYEPDTPLWQVLTLPANDDDLIVSRHLLVNPIFAWITQKVLYEFFDGELSGVFTEKRRQI